MYCNDGISLSMAFLFCALIHRKQREGRRCIFFWGEQTQLFCENYRSGWAPLDCRGSGPAGRWVWRPGSSPGCPHTAAPRTRRCCWCLPPRPAEGTGNMFQSSRTDVFSAESTVSSGPTSTPAYGVKSRGEMCFFSSLSGKNRNI